VDKACVNLVGFRQDIDVFRKGVGHVAPLGSEACDSKCVAGLWLDGDV
jgi:hypothetical protein